ncbi:MAG TPA: hypothetical protein VM577_05575 [Anaerovoracaceae bacterium]|nr:hypothetical protein [Anaerovoracaceae bacterium]
MKRTLCANGCGRPPFFRVKGGPIKQDAYHSLCMQCYRDQRNSVYAQAKKDRTCKQPEKALISGSEPPEGKGDVMSELPWSERHHVMNMLVKEKTVVFQGIDLPDPEDPSDPEFTAIIHIGNTGAGTETIFGDRIIGTGIPSLMVPTWNKDSLKYLKHWLFKVFDDPLIYRGTQIVIKISGDWQKNFKR